MMIVMIISMNTPVTCCVQSYFPLVYEWLFTLVNFYIDKVVVSPCCFDTVVTGCEGSINMASGIMIRRYGF